MESAWPMLLFLIGLFGVVLLLLLGGIAGHELEREEQQGSADLVAGRSFFAAIGAAFDIAPAVDHASVQAVESSLRRKAELAARFVDRPSVHAFHEPAEVCASPSVFDRIQSFLQRERCLACEFVSDPTLDRFHDQSGVVLA